MRIYPFLGTILALSVGLEGIFAQRSGAVQLSDGTVYFVQPPSLVSVTTTFNEVWVWDSIYYFTLSLPENAGEPLQRVTINQYEGIENISYSLRETRAFEGTRRKKGANITLGSITRENDQTISVTFDPPVPPGKTVTIALYPVRNPMTSGVYLFGVTAFPPGEKVHGQFLGYGRLHFYGRGFF